MAKTWLETFAATDSAGVTILAAPYLWSSFLWRSLLDRLNEEYKRELYFSYLYKITGVTNLHFIKYYCYYQTMTP